MRGGTIRAPRVSVIMHAGIQWRSLSRRRGREYSERQGAGIGHIFLAGLERGTYSACQRIRRMWLADLAKRLLIVEMTDIDAMDRLRRLLKRMPEFATSTLKSLLASLVEDKKYQLWLTNKHKLEEWMKHGDLIESAIHAHKRKTEAPREFEGEFQKFRTLLERSGRTIPMRWDEILPCLNDRSPETPFDPHYTYHPAWAARVLARTRPVKHVDISSILCFGAVVSAFIPVEFYDFRPAPLRLSNFAATSADLNSSRISR